MKKQIIVIVAIAAITGGGAFYGGMEYAENKNPSGQFARGDFQNLSPEERQPRMQEMGANVSAGFNARIGDGQRGGEGLVSGEIIFKDDKSIIVKLMDGGSKIVFFSESTEISKSAKGTLPDLEVGKDVLVNGSANSDGSVTAKLIQLR